MFNLISLLNKTIEFGFYALFFFVPLVFTDKTYELFEFNKMMLVYLLTIVIVAAWLLKMIETRNFYVKQTPFDLPLLLFLTVNIISTVFSIDPHVSFWGYYSRFNGGLLSTIVYIALYYAFVSNINKVSKVFKMISVTLISSLVVSLWGITSHFGFDPACFIINREIGVGCWQGEFNPTVRVFSTLGQFNWLAAFLAMLIPLFLSLMITTKTDLKRSAYLICSVILYLTFTLTYSRGGSFGLIAGLMVFFVLLGFQVFKKSLRWLALVGALFLLVNILFSNAFTARPVKMIDVSQSVEDSVSAGTDTGQNRIIVWRGALEIAKHYPIFGSGVETFTFSYYQFRLKEHNLLGSEWDVLFNKAHNEFLNYLATTGSIGFLSYLLLIASFFWVTLKYLTKELFSTQKLIVIALVSGYTSYLVQNVFGFSVVPIALLFYLFPAAVSILVNPKGEQYLNLQAVQRLSRLFNFIPLNAKKVTSQGLIIFTSIYLFVQIIALWQADVQFAKGIRQNNYTALKNAVNLNPSEPLYHSELGYAAAVLANQEKSDNEKERLIREALTEGEKSINLSPGNLNYWKNLIRLYYELSKSNGTYLNKALEAALRGVELAPTDARLHFNLGLLYKETNQIEKAIKTQEETVTLKPDYKEAYYELAAAYEKQQDKEKATTTLEKLLKIFPEDKETLDKINQLKESK